MVESEQFDVPIHQLKLTYAQRCDLELLLTGAFLPLKGFLKQLDYKSVLKTGRLHSGAIWPIPITLEVSEELASQLTLGQKLALLRNDGSPLARFLVEDIFEIDTSLEAESVFGSLDQEHPSICSLLSRKTRFYVGGEVEEWGDDTTTRYAQLDFPPEYNTPTRIQQYRNNGSLIAFQTRNPLHYAHIAITKKALEMVGNGSKLLLQPAIGPTKKGDIEPSVRMRAYRAALSSYEHGTVILSPIPLAMRMAGPKEALWHTLIRANFGASHFIIGRGHADPGKKSGGLFYPEFSAQEYVAKYSDELRIMPLFVPEFGYSKSQNSYVSISSIESVESQNDIQFLSGTEFRRRLANNESIPEWFSPLPVIQVLKNAYGSRKRGGIVFWFTGLPASGKSTLARLFERYLEANDEREVTMLDGDMVREYLSKGLGYSKVDRNENIKRIAYVSSIIARHGGIALVAAVSPYRSARLDARNLVEENGGMFVEIHVSTPIDTCINRDPKGLYKQAIAGKIRFFTGIDDPYEEPSIPDIKISCDLPTQLEVFESLLIQLKSLKIIPD